MSKHSYTGILDVDETLLNPLTLYEQGINAEMNLDITVSQVEEAGGLEELFRDHLRFQNSPRY